jgi:hypothetical protein
MKVHVVLDAGPWEYEIDVPEELDFNIEAGIDYAEQQAVELANQEVRNWGVTWEVAQTDIEIG